MWRCKVALHIIYYTAAGNLKIKRIFFFSLLFLAGCVYMKDPLRKEAHGLQSGRLIDTTSYIYDLPYPKGVAHYMVQGYFTQFTHKRRAALDFKMPIGSIICAARSGVVIRIKNDGQRGGPQSKYRKEGNFMIIQHSDSTRAGYWHLKHKGTLVQLGDTVKTGQPIALSGNTGYTYFPHLHFIIWGYDKRKRFVQIPSRFRTQNGARFLKAIRLYKNPVK